ncbi:MAG: signal peptidase II [Rhizobiales bacterium]|nr:signal peptidase II [Hyphomicrobiales bacterium]MBN9010360.1 signal peptidase II [Hyphomicrobiales bacterium]
MADLLGARPPGPLSALGIIVAVATLAIDQAGKLLAEAHLPFGETIDVLPILALHRTYNTGIAFSMLDFAGGLPLIVMSLAVIAVVIGFWWKASEGGWIAATGFALILGGALGNLVDRILYGHVIDFLLLHFGDTVLFVFNIADAALTVGPALLLLVYLWPRRAAPRAGG